MQPCLYSPHDTMFYTINKSFLQSRKSRNCFDQVIKVDSEDSIYTTLASTLSVLILLPFYMAAFLCFLSPVGYLDGRFSLYTATSGDGFTMHMGFLGSCTRSSDNQPFDCTKFSLSSPFGDFSVKINPALGQANQFNLLLLLREEVF
ncbi:hypothetical protein PNOK_0222100 [Pyrrhoderma noxium]|uniref:Uncharacterized protein n=1 Tax=Pyrrhoderma noxium TaxID=2282107 RepID=A0A286URV9_9AGAM|nr:hypothetical protein PNOK_0222100 [Pyrrhoderma noxium]